MLDNFLNQLRGNPRLRWGIALIVGIFWLYGILLLRDTLQDQEQQHRVTAQSVARLRTQLAHPEWTSRVIPAETKALQMEERLWQAPTSGLAQAAFQDWLNASSTQAGIIHPQITASVIEEAVANTTDQSDSAGITAPANLWKITAKLASDFSTQNFLSLMNLIENHEKQIIVVALNIRKEPTPRIEMELNGYFLKLDAAANDKPDKALVPL